MVYWITQDPVTRLCYWCVSKPEGWISAEGYVNADSACAAAESYGHTEHPDTTAYRASIVGLYPPQQA